MIGRSARAAARRAAAPRGRSYVPRRRSRSTRVDLVRIAPARAAMPRRSGPRSGSRSRERRRSSVDVVLGAPELDVRRRAAPSTRPARPSYGMPTLPGLTTRYAADHAGRTGRGRARDDDVAPRRPRALGKRSSGVSRGHDLLVAPRRRVAEEDAAEPVDVERARTRERPSPSTSAWAARRAARAARLELTVGVAEHEDARSPSSRAASSARAARAGDHVAAEDDPVRPRAAHLGEHRLERRQVAVDVVERGDPHLDPPPPAAATRLAAVQPRARRRRRRAPGSPRRRTRSASAGTRRRGCDAIAAESSASSSGTSSRRNVVETGASGRSRNVVDDLDLVGAGAEARERVDEPLEPVVRARRSPSGVALGERRSSCSRRRARARPRAWRTSRQPWSSTPSCSNVNGRSARRPSSAAMRARELRLAVRLDERRIRSTLLVGRAGYQRAHRLDVRARAGARGRRRSSRRWTASPISVAARPVVPGRGRRCAVALAHPGDPLGEVAVRAALEERERAEGEPAHVVERRRRRPARAAAASARAAGSCGSSDRGRRAPAARPSSRRPGRRPRPRRRRGVLRSTRTSSARPRARARPASSLGGASSSRASSRAEHPADRRPRVGRARSASTAPETISRSIARVIAT